MWIYAHPSREQDVPEDAIADGHMVIFDRFCPPNYIYRTEEQLWDPDVDGFEGDIGPAQE